MTVRIAARDGFPLAAKVHGGPSKRRVVIAPATGVPAAYYDRFATWLTEHGWPALTFDYRGIGESRPRTLRGFRADMMDWAERDLAAVVDHARTDLGAERVMIVGHSFGGQAVGLLPNADAVGGFVGIGAQLGDYRLWPAPERYAFAALMYTVVPLTARAVGYLPGRLGIGQDLPRDVARQWARWCTRRGYYVAGRRAALRERIARVTAPVRLYSFADDRYAPERSVDALGALLERAPVERRHLDPRDYGGRIGHFGFFRPRFEASLWPEVTAFFERAEHAPSGAPVPVVDPAYEEQVALDRFLFDRHARNAAMSDA